MNPIAKDQTNSAVPAGSSEAFAQRHIGPSGPEVDAMLKTLGVKSLDALIEQAVPASILDQGKLTFGPALSETETIAFLREVAGKNKVLTSLIGQGYYGTIVPAVIQRNILENPAWYTAYTPYQPEISQGRLEALINYQTMICDLTGLDIANASLLDEATAAAEAMAMAKRQAGSKSNRFFVDLNCHRQTIAVLETRSKPLGWELVIGDPATLQAEDVFGAIFQYPGTDGSIVDYRGAIAALHAHGAAAIVATDLLALTLLTPPGELGADIAIGSTQRFGVPMGYGGPHAAFLSTRDEYKRTLPGRLVGVSIDSRGAQAYRLALQTREQHIRREKATSNICTAQVLLAVMASMYAVYHGPEGLMAIARRVHGLTTRLAAGLRKLGFEATSNAFFDTLTVPTGKRTEEIHAAAVSAGINLRRIPGGAQVGISLDETSTPALVEALWGCFGTARKFDTVSASDALPESLLRASKILQYPVFEQYHSETEMLRYMRRLADRDLALDRSMIPLGSCTMKLNATTEMLPVTWPEFGSLHPFVPADQARGYTELFAALEQRLCAITGYDAFTFQPNSGAQGEYAGLLAIGAYHASRGEAHRKICLIPASAHGTNPASAQMVGMEVVGVKCDEDGNVDVDDLRAKASKYADILAAVMITYPSTHGVFEERVREICEIVHAAGGQVYLDGANLNAQVGIVYPGKFGADVSHLNLHKTFCIPHGGGGPGVGPVGVRAHLAPFLPGHPELGVSHEANAVGPVSAAPFGSASILPISWAYILLMGGAGLTLATKVAILNANYIAARLEPHFPVLYRNEHGRVAHECILDTRPLKTTCGVGVDDIAKRLIDYGFHAPTMSFPVSGTLMVEPTESESKREIDRFINAMIALRNEIGEIEAGKFKVEESPLRHAPHTVYDLTDDVWDRPYTRAQGCFPATSRRQDKYWAPVNRIDNAYGDRNLFCSCPPTAEYAEAISE